MEENVNEKINKILCQCLSIENNKLNNNLLLKEDLDISSIDSIIISSMLENEFQINITSNNMSKLNTVNDIKILIEEKINEKK